MKELLIILGNCKKYVLNVPIEIILIQLALQSIKIKTSSIRKKKIFLFAETKAAIFFSNSLYSHKVGVANLNLQGNSFIHN